MAAGSGIWGATGKHENGTPNTQYSCYCAGWQQRYPTPVCSGPASEQSPRCDGGSWAPLLQFNIMCSWVVLVSTPIWCPVKGCAGGVAWLSSHVQSISITLAWWWCRFWESQKERHRWPEELLISRRSGTHYIAMVTKTVKMCSGAHLLQSYSKESNMSDTNWLRYLFSSFIMKIWVSVWHHYLTNLQF